MKKKLITFIIAFFLISCNSKKQSNKDVDITDSIISNHETEDVIIKDKFIDFPIPELDSIFPYFETSGMVANAPSERFYNPTDSGIFVFYTLFKKNKIKNSKISFDEKFIGTLTTHTFRKPKYGWSENDKDQTFILLHLYNKPIMIGKSIQIGMSYNELINELGKPIYKVDSTFIFLGKNKIVGQFNFNKEKLASLIYGRFNLANEIFEMDSLSRKKIIEKILHKME